MNKFSIDTRPDGSVAQFYSDLSLNDFDGKELLRKTISVNDPFRYGGVTMYQVSCCGQPLSEIRKGFRQGVSGFSGKGGLENASAKAVLQLFCVPARSVAVCCWLGVSTVGQQGAKRPSTTPSSPARARACLKPARFSCKPTCCFRLVAVCRLPQL